MGKSFAIVPQVQSMQKQSFLRTRKKRWIEYPAAVVWKKWKAICVEPDYFGGGNDNRLQ